MPTVGCWYDANLDWRTGCAFIHHHVQLRKRLRLTLDDECSLAQWCTVTISLLDGLAQTECYGLTRQPDQAKKFCCKTNSFEKTLLCDAAELRSENIAGEASHPSVRNAAIYSN